MAALTLVVVNYFSETQVERCLRSVRDSPGGPTIEVVIVSNGTDPSARDRLLAGLPEVRWIEMGYNAGFARANNRGFREAAGEWILMLNPDTWVLPETMAACGTFMAERAGTLCLAGPALLNVDGSPQRSQYFAIGSYRELLADNYLLRRLGLRKAEAGPIRALSGACLLFPAALLSRTGGMDESFFLYGEEIEWCERIRREGVELVYEPRIRVVHVGEGTSTLPSTGRQRIVSHAWLYRKLRGRWGAAGFAAVFLFNWLTQIPFFPFYSADGRRRLREQSRLFWPLARAAARMTVRPLTGGEWVKETA